MLSWPAEELESHNHKPTRKEARLQRAYANLLKLIKEKVNPTEIWVDIDRVGKTRNGKLLKKIQTTSFFSY